MEPKNRYEVTFDFYFGVLYYILELDYQYAKHGIDWEYDVYIGGPKGYRVVVQTL